MPPPRQIESQNPLTTMSTNPRHVIVTPAHPRKDPERYPICIAATPTAAAAAPTVPTAATTPPQPRSGTCCTAAASSATCSDSSLTTTPSPSTRKTHCRNP
ncbi:hypothetical protein BU25DRAFT_460160 [Macroventuria anomochaeta]|uniref:Uncharacterized protein n=1 Tax=Macroventuria anomochaeta TaxID=301207 RepID=A0ACB6RVY3_9PLEO|nr:uncharacterized protein BU25DRAFT_460160 [Macroventuria anomochaeta]KAF2625422.1 hypothetical protein BU25DRAFT_460160 [Macroventuria anomochaeta]